MSTVRNVLFIMCDQLRADYLSCYGHPTLATPNIDQLAEHGVRFERAYVQAPVCGPSRMSFYTGRYVASHGATWNFVPLPLGERTLGEYMRPHGVRVAVIGKTHFEADVEGLARAGIDPRSTEGRLFAEGGFEPYARHDGIYPDGRDWSGLPYNEFLRRHGYGGDNPWHSHANSAAGANGESLSGWFMRNASLPARVRDEHSETAWITDRAMEFVREQGERPWCLHLSYIKPHWPYMAAAPYHAMYRRQDCAAPLRAPGEREEAHPVYAAFTRHPEAVAFSRTDVRQAVVPTYMGLVRQIDDHLGRLFACLEDLGRWQDTVVIFTSDHGDYLGDHWLGEKELFFEQSIRVPLIVFDPLSDATRGTATAAIVEAIDLLPTILDALEIPCRRDLLEGQSLLPLLRSRHGRTRGEAFAELDYALYPAARELGLDWHRARAVMIRTDRWKLVHYDGFRPQLFDLERDPNEFQDLGSDRSFVGARIELYERLFSWTRRRRNRAAMSDETLRDIGDRSRPKGLAIRIGQW
jgi:arylsulfatase A-like enzyme